MEIESPANLTGSQMSFLLKDEGREKEEEDEEKEKLSRQKREEENMEG